MNHNFKYHSNKDLDSLIEGLRANLMIVEVAEELDLDLKDLALDSFTEKQRKEDLDMLKQAETELLERMLLGKES